MGRLLYAIAATTITYSPSRSSWTQLWDMCESNTTKVSLARLWEHQLQKDWLQATSVSATRPDLNPILLWTLSRVQLSTHEAAATCFFYIDGPCWARCECSCSIPSPDLRRSKVCSTCVGSWSWNMCVVTWFRTSRYQNDCSTISAHHTITLSTYSKTVKTSCPIHIPGSPEGV